MEGVLRTKFQSLHIVLRSAALITAGVGAFWIFELGPNLADSQGLFQSQKSFESCKVRLDKTKSSFIGGPSKFYSRYLSKNFLNKTENCFDQSGQYLSSLDSKEALSSANKLRYFSKKLENFNNIILKEVITKSFDRGLVQSSTNLIFSLYSDTLDQLRTDQVQIQSRVSKSNNIFYALSLFLVLFCIGILLDIGQRFKRKQDVKSVSKADQFVSSLLAKDDLPEMEEVSSTIENALRTHKLEDLSKLFNLYSKNIVQKYKASNKLENIESILNNMPLSYAPRPEEVIKQKTEQEIEHKIEQKIEEKGELLKAEVITNSAELNTILDEVLFEMSNDFVGAQAQVDINIANNLPVSANAENLKVFFKRVFQSQLKQTIKINKKKCLQINSIIKDHKVILSVISGEYNWVEEKLSNTAELMRKAKDWKADFNQMNQESIIEEFKKTKFMTRVLTRDHSVKGVMTSIQFEPYKEKKVYFQTEQSL